MIAAPGAETSRAGDALENGATASFWSVAATVNTCGEEAGYAAELPRRPLFPTDATTRQPLCTAVRIASFTSASKELPPKLRLITPGQCCAAARMPWLAATSLMSPGAGLASKSCSAAVG